MLKNPSNFLTFLNIFLKYNYYMKKIIVISGKQYSGKDTLAKILLEKLSGYRRIGIGDAIKIQFAKENNLSLDEVIQNKHLYRQGLIELGNYGRNISDDYWLRVLEKEDKIIVPDIRVEFEANFFRKIGAFLIRVESDIENRKKRGIITMENDATETALDCYKNWNIKIENNSDYNNLKQQADKILVEFKNFIG